MKKNMFTTRNLTRIAILVAISIMLKSFLSFETQMFRATLYDIPLIILGITTGPIAGFVGGFVVDLVHIIMSPFAFTFNFFTLGSISWGLIPGLFLFKKGLSLKTVIAVVMFTSMIAFTFNSLGILTYYGMGAVIGGLPSRIIVFAVKIPIQVFLVHGLLKRLYAIEDTQTEVYTN